jgi:sulfite reductase (NADPH) flavoprotein alpha-component
MNAPSPPQTVTFIPETAPFSPEQRAWLNGFFAGYLAPGAVEAPADLGDLGGAEDDDAPWHDPAIPLDERMQMAEGKPLRRRMMAAMAQQDCGQCGYNCNDYADAIATKAEPRLNLCVPGEKATARMLKALAVELDGAAAPAAPAAEPAAAPAPVADVPAGTSRANPAEVVFLSRRRLNKEDSEKSTFHIEFDLSAAGLDYTVGDSFGLFPENDPALVDSILDALHTPPDFPIAGRPLREVLLKDTALGAAPDALFELISYLVGGERKRKAKLLAKGEDPDGDAHTLDVLAAIEKFPGIRPDPEAFIEVLEPLQPRLYSISSSPKATPGRLSLTVDHVRYLIGERIRRGVASSWLSERLPTHSKLKAYVQKAHDFALPADGATPIIMCGPGTGVAPFRAFLHERAATGATGETWLFFGHQRRAADFFYEDEMEEFLKTGVLSKLFLAWSRDGDTKVYVQDKMREAAAELWAMFEKGAHFYICGDAKRMASDVERALVDIVSQHGQRDEAAAKAFLKDMKKSGRYQADVY